MKKIIFVNIPMKNMDKDTPLSYAGCGNAGCLCDEEVYFSTNAYLTEEIEKDDDVKIVMLRTIADTEKLNEESLKNIELFKKEFNTLCSKNCHNVEFKTIETPFEETKETMEKRYRNMLGELEENCEIYANIDFGPRLNLMILMNVLNFAEKFFNADIKSILYTKIEFKHPENKVIPGSQKLFDITSFYYLNNLTNSMQAKNGEQALKSLDAFFKL